MTKKRKKNVWLTESALKLYAVSKNAHSNKQTNKLFFKEVKTFYVQINRINKYFLKLVKKQFPQFYDANMNLRILKNFFFKKYLILANNVRETPSRSSTKSVFDV